jgi:hypothetical protein
MCDVLFKCFNFRRFFYNYNWHTKNHLSAKNTGPPAPPGRFHQL